ncbi:ABC transporter substrate-binding protein [Haloprofundus halobius]|uniref:ABC transporter substrate-binding protein n=1 Tax=Haloprofundus halobius TaxID=2876194 RepID=UPI001CCFBBDC|nr:ABC transporter substrate-binding protein [Haloprofundus halobius]
MRENYKRSKQQSNGRRLGRRQLLYGLGAAGTATLLAGCGGQSPSNSEESGGGGNESENESAGGGNEAGSNIDATDEELKTIQELAHVTNQELPLLPVMEKLAQSFQTTDDWNVPEPDSDEQMHYWPTEWLVRWGEWTADGDDDTLTLAQWINPQDAQYNDWNPEGGAEVDRMVYDRFMSYNIVEAEYDGYAISDWEFDGDSISLTLRDGLVWHDGDEATGQDVANQIKLDMYTGGSLSDYVDDVAESVSVDGNSVTLQFNETLNEQIILSLLQPKYLAAKDSIFGEYVELYDNAENEDEEAAAYEELSSMTLEEPVGTGPFSFEDADSRRALATKFEDHPDADQVEVENVEYLFMPENQNRWTSLQEGEMDGDATLFMPQNQVDQLPDHVQISLLPRHWGMGLIFQHDDDHMGKREVRQAIAHAVDRDAVAQYSSANTDSKLGVSYPCGLTGDFSGKVEDEWLDGVTDQFNQYAYDTDRAAELLEEAGYSEDGDGWVDENGNSLEVPIKVPSGFSDWVSAAETIVSNLNDFGVASEMITRENGAYFGTDLPDGDFVVACEGWASYDHVYPYFHFDHIYTGGSTSLQSVANFPEEYEVSPLHDDIREGGTVDPTELIDSLAVLETDE